MFLLIGLVNIHAENPCGIMSPRSGSGAWGMGGLYLTNGEHLSVFDQSGKKIGSVERLKHNYVLKTDYTDHSGKIQSLWKAQESVGHYQYSILRVSKTSNEERFKIHWANEEGLNLFITAKDLNKSNGDFCTYAELLFNEYIPEELLKGRNMAKLGVNLERNCLNLREAPNKEANKIFCIPSNDFDNFAYAHVKQKASHNNWMKVHVNNCSPPNKVVIDEENDEGCHCRGKESEYLGWIKAIDENGFPNIWFSSTSY